MSLVLQTWAELLDLPDIQPEDDFLEIGGSSMQMLAMINQLELRFDREIDIIELIDGVTPRRLAALLRGPEAAATA